MDPPFFSPIDRNGYREYNDNATSVADRAKRGIVSGQLKRPLRAQLK